jgi:hypothetical protein
MHWFASNASNVSGSSLYDVGGVDSFLFNTSLGNSGDQTELDWVNEKLGTNYTMDEFNKIETNNGNGWIGIDNYASIYAYNVKIFNLHIF